MGRLNTITATEGPIEARSTPLSVSERPGDGCVYVDVAYGPIRYYLNVPAVRVPRALASLILTVRARCRRG